ncbi:MAG: PepSY domain-containing protein [Flavobacteriaceae bacterium]|nr:PepSY domain-containing protein [Flavobacteriaceae bacterium]
MVKFFKKYHKWIGIVSVFFVLVFAVSGILLNHRKGISAFDIARNYFPEKYHFKNWNNGAVKGSVKLATDSILLYGTSGVYLTNPQAEIFTPYHKGMAKGIENRTLRALVRTESNAVFGCSTYELYALHKETDTWQPIATKIPTEDAFSDLCVKKDILFVVTRSEIFKAIPPYEVFTKIDLPASTDFANKVSLFKTMWILHSGEIFGLFGKLVVDFIGLIVVIITVTGLALTLFRIPIRKRKKKKKPVEILKNGWKCSLNWHNKLGIYFFFMLVFVVLTGTFLRPPLLIVIVRSKVAPVPYSTLDSKNPWHEKLRVLRYDAFSEKWLLYTSEGFYTFSDFTESPKPLIKKPPVSVMGVTVLEQKTEKEWLVGSFSGLYRWNSESGVVHNAFTGKLHEVKPTLGPPSFDNPINGYSADFLCGEVAFDYGKGAICLNANSQFAKMPHFFEHLPMSLWNIALELHTGRMYTFLGIVGVLFIFGSGLLFLFVLISGYIVYKKRHKKRKK